MAKRKNKVTPFIFKTFSERQKQLMYCWTDISPYKDYNIIVASGSIRAGKSIAAICGFLLWSQSEFVGHEFAIVGKSHGAITRNIVRPMMQILDAWGWNYHYTQETLVIGSNTYNIFGAPNESSQDVLQGMTLAGALVDEAALIPENYFDQLNGRMISISNHKIWVTCNPSSPRNYLKEKWIDLRDTKSLLYLHFTLDDNLSLSEEDKNKAKKKYMGPDGDLSNVFYRRYILGKWCSADGLCYTSFSQNNIVDKLPQMIEYFVGADFGDNHPTTFTLLGKGRDGNYYVVKEYKQNKQLIDKYAKDLKQFINGYPIRPIIVDSAASTFIRQIASLGMPVKGINKSSMTVANAIGEINSLFGNNKLFIYRGCKETINELYSYSWDKKASEKGKDEVVKLGDDLMDSMRYGLMEYVINKRQITGSRIGSY